MTPPTPMPCFAIACGGTGGHLYPGLAVAAELQARGADILLLISRKEVDQAAVQGLRDVRVTALPAVGLERGRWLAFIRGFRAAWQETRTAFEPRLPDAVLAMGGFTSAAPALLAWRLRRPIFLHEANAIPGRANRWLARFATTGFVHFEAARRRFPCRHVEVTGMPVREQFQPADREACRMALGLAPERPVLLVMGGSQGARGINDLMLRTLPRLSPLVPGLQLIHLTGPNDSQALEQACAAAGLRALIRPYFTEMELALGAADLAVTRAGASSLAELAAMRVPAFLIPYPHAADDHQRANAQALAATGAARVQEESTADPATFAEAIAALLRDQDSRQRMESALAAWHRPGAAARMVDAMRRELPKATATLLEAPPGAPCTCPSR